MDTVVEALTDLLRRAGSAHHEAFAATDGVDPEWPLWYSAYLEERLGEVMDARPTRSRLVHWLVAADDAHRADADDEPWEPFFARYLYDEIEAG